MKKIWRSLIGMMAFSVINAETNGVMKTVEFTLLKDGDGMYGR